MQMEDRLACALPHVHDRHDNPRARPPARSRRRSRASASPLGRELGDLAEASRRAARGARAGACRPSGRCRGSATKPSAARTWSPSRTSVQKRQSSGSADPLLGDRRAADAHELADRRVDEPRRVVVAVAAARAGRRARRPRGRASRASARGTQRARPRAAARSGRA